MAYGKLLPDKRKRGLYEMREVVRVRGMDVCCDESIINEVLGVKEYIYSLLCY